MSDSISNCQIRGCLLYRMNVFAEGKVSEPVCERHYDEWVEHRQPYGEPLSFFIFAKNFASIMKTSNKEPQSVHHLQKLLLELDRSRAAEDELK